MRVICRYIAYCGLLLVIAFNGFLPAAGQDDVQAQSSSRTLAWSIVDTPSALNNVILSPSEINSLALGSDGTTFYCVDTAQGKLYKSTDGGYTWPTDLSGNVVRAGATLPVWDIVIAPDNVNFIIAVTGGSALTQGPRQLYYSTDGGANWTNTAFPPLVTEYISCLDISKNYGTASVFRDLAVGTRSTLGAGRVFTIQFSSSAFGLWSNQGFLTGNNVTSLKFSPSYDSDLTIAVVSSTATNMYLNLGKHDTAANTTNWNGGDYAGYPIGLGISNSGNVITTCLALPSGYLAGGATQPGCWVSIMAVNTTAVLYVDNGISPSVMNITPPTPATANRIRSIAYRGSVTTGILLAGECLTSPGRGLASVWQCSNPQATTLGAAVWTPSNDYKSPTGGANSGRANSILAWSVNGNAYCGTSSANTIVGGTGNAAGQWPFGQLVSVALDESALSRSTDNGYTWNQLSLIDTAISRLSDVAALEVAPDVTDDYSVLYLSSLNTGSAIFTPDSVWRSTSDPLGTTWERILCFPSSDSGTILRINPRGAIDSGGSARSEVVIYADLNTDNIFSSIDEGNIWAEVVASVDVCDISLMDDNTMFVLEDYSVVRLTYNGADWLPGKKINTNLLGPGHTIYTPMEQSITSGNIEQSIVLVGTTGDYDSYVAWADFSKSAPEFKQLEVLPEMGDVHIVADSEFKKNRLIYVALRDINNNQGTIYRWEIGKSDDWDEMEPPNLAFYGADMLGDVLYAAWDLYVTKPNLEGGVDRTLYPRLKVPPPPEWDELRVADYVERSTPVHFTREPVSLKVSTNRYNTLWAVDNTTYQFNTDNGTGCLWAFVDSIAKLGPWPTLPATGSSISPDTVTGRAKQIDFKWRSLPDIYGYDLRISKDENFTLPMDPHIQGEIVDLDTGAFTIHPADYDDPSCWIPPGVLEVGRSYYWSIRGSRSVMGYKIHSPWSPIMFFSVKPGFTVRSVYHGPNLITPVNGPCTECHPPLKFSWAPVEGATRYEISMAKDPEFKNPVFTGISSGTAYEYKDKLEQNKAYYWRVKVIEPVASDSSPVGTFLLTEAKPAPVKTQDKVQTKPEAPPAPNFWIWIIIVIAMLLLVLINVLAFISRNRD